MACQIVLLGSSLHSDLIQVPHRRHGVSGFPTDEKAMLWMKEKFYGEVLVGKLFMLGIRISRMSDTLCIRLGLGFIVLTFGMRPEVEPDGDSEVEMKTAA